MSALTAEPARYPYWLDAEWFHPNTRLRRPDEVSQDPESVMLEQADRRIKLYALFGVNLVLSDVQIFESPPVLDLFSDEDFVGFLEDHPRFLQLVARPRKQRSRQQYSVALAGLDRTDEDGWTSSTHRTEIIKELATAIREEYDRHGDVDAEQMLRDSRSGSAGALIATFEGRAGRWLRAAVRSIAHFGRASEECVRPPDPGRSPHNLYQMLQDASKIPQDKRYGPEELKNGVEITLEYVERYGGAFDKARRAPIFTFLETHRDTWERYGPIRRLAIRRTLVQAWNAATQRSNWSQGSPSFMPHGALVGLYTQQPMDALVRAEFLLRLGDEDEINSLVLGNPLPDPATISWGELRSVTERLEHERAGFAQALATNRGLRTATRDYVAALSDQLSPTPSAAKFIWALPISAGLLLVASGFNPGWGVAAVATKGLAGAGRQLLRRREWQNRATRYAESLSVTEGEGR